MNDVVMDGRGRQVERVRPVLQVLLLLGIGALVALAKRLEPSLGIPGSSAPLWLGALIAGCAMVRRKGAGTIAGASVALWGVPIGLSHTFLGNLGLYGFTGLALDLVTGLPGIDLRRPLGAVAAGAMAHMVKFLFVLDSAYAMSVEKHFIVVGIERSALLHLAFGAAAGLAGWLVYKVVVRATANTGLSGIH